MSSAILTNPTPVPSATEDPPWIKLERALKARPAPWAEEEIIRLSKLFPVDDGEPMETFRHVSNMTSLIGIVSWYWRERRDYFVGGNMFVHYSPEQLLKENFLGPDFFIVLEATFNPMRDNWIVWQENNKYPDLIIELASPSTEKKDRGEKKDIYEQIFRTKEYMIYDPITCELDGWHLKGRSKRYKEIRPDAQGRIWSDVLAAYLGPWTGKYHEAEGQWLRLFDRDGNLILNQAEDETRRADEEKRLKEDEKLRADEEKRLKEDEKLRADLAEFEVKRLREQLKQLQSKTNGSQTN